MTPNIKRICGLYVLTVPEQVMESAAKGLGHACLSFSESEIKQLALLFLHAVDRGILTGHILDGEEIFPRGKP